MTRPNNYYDLRLCPFCSLFFFRNYHYLPFSNVVNIVTVHVVYVNINKQLFAFITQGVTSWQPFHPFPPDPLVWESIKLGSLP